MTASEGFGPTIAGLSVPFERSSWEKTQTKTPSWRQFKNSPFMNSISKDIESILRAKPGSEKQKNTRTKVSDLMKFLSFSLQYEGFPDMLNASRYNFPRDNFGHTGKLVTLLCMASAASDFDSPSDFNPGILEAKFGLAATHISIQIPEIAGASKKKVVNLTNRDLLEAYIEGSLL